MVVIILSDYLCICNKLGSAQKIHNGVRKVLRNHIQIHSYIQTILQNVFNLGVEFMVSFSSCSQAVMKESSNDTFFLVQKEVLGEKIIIWVKYGNVFAQIMMFSFKSWWLESERTSERKKELQILVLYGRSKLKQISHKL